MSANFEQILINKESEFLAAAKIGNVNKLQALLEQGVDVNTIDGLSGYSALMFASKEGHFHAVKFLIENKADLNIRNNDWDAPYFELSEYTLQDVRSALMLAAENGHFEIAELLIEAGAKIDFVSNDEGKYECNSPSALGLAAKKGILTIVTLLVNNGANIEINKEETSALGWAVRKNHHAIVKFLMDEGADVHHYDSEGYNPIMLARVRRDRDLIRLLTARKYQPESKDQLESDNEIAISDSEKENRDRQMPLMSFWQKPVENGPRPNHGIVAQGNVVGFRQEMASMQI
jgi:ankyrin repeat protein